MRVQQTPVVDWIAECTHARYSIERNQVRCFAREDWIPAKILSASTAEAARPILSAAARFVSQAIR
ncbi:MAG: hypothetical protein JWN86_4155 [Planctomycetota bacterium]|nr:hypothetical protein [Planctomycetota bacterium]